jgi:hypothetical protein
MWESKEVKGQKVKKRKINLQVIELNTFVTDFGCKNDLIKESLKTQSYRQKKMGTRKTILRLITNK